MEPGVLLVGYPERELVVLAVVLSDQDLVSGGRAEGQGRSLEAARR